MQSDLAVSTIIEGLYAAAKCASVGPYLCPMSIRVSRYAIAYNVEIALLILSSKFFHTL